MSPRLSKLRSAVARAEGHVVSVELLHQNTDGKVSDPVLDRSARFYQNLTLLSTDLC